MAVTTATEKRYQEIIESQTNRIMQVQDMATGQALAFRETAGAISAGIKPLDLVRRAMKPLIEEVEKALEAGDEAHKQRALEHTAKVLHSSLSSVEMCTKGLTEVMTNVNSAANNIMDEVLNTTIARASNG